MDEQKKAYYREYYLNNKEKYIKSRNKYYRANKDKFKAYYQDHRKEKLQYQTQYRYLNEKSRSHKINVMNKKIKSVDIIT